MRKAILKDIMNKPIPKSKPENRILGISGSPRKNGNSDIILRNIIAGASEKNISSSSINLRDIQFTGCIGCELCRKDKICTGLIDGMTSIYKHIISSKGIILVSPTHNYNITSWMKAFIDRMYCFYNFEKSIPRAWSSQIAGQNRKAVIASICEQENKKDMGFTLEAMKEPLKALGYDIVGELAIFKIFDKGKVKKDTESMKKAYNLGTVLAESLL